MKLFRTKYGYFSDSGLEYVITRPDTPRPWVNVISNGDYGLVVSQTGSGYSWRTHASLNRINRWEQDLIKDEWGKFIYILDRESRQFWSAGWKPVCSRPESYRCRHGIGYTVIESSNAGIESSLLLFVAPDEPLEIWKLTLANTSKRVRKLSVASYMELGLGVAPDWHREFHKCFIETDFNKVLGAVFATNRLWEVPSERGHWNTHWPYVAFHACNLPVASYDCDKETFLGRYGNVAAPSAVVRGRPGKRTGKWTEPIASIFTNVTMRPNQSRSLYFVLGAADNRDHAVELVKKYKSPAAAEEAYRTVRARWEALLGTTKVETPYPAIDIMLNVWLKYQAISGRLWGRTAYYQIGGAFGFRDQLQDSQIFLPIDPNETKMQLLLHAQHQFRDGTVYHWWHPLTEVGHRTAMTDDLLWLPYVVHSYLEETADFSILDEKTRFIDDETPATLYDHCVRAIDKVLQRFSERGLPLIGAGDWNDGLNAVGLAMRGESVWLGHFLHRILNDFSSVCERYGKYDRSEVYRGRARELRAALNEQAWDGKWYYRATKDSGERLGSHTNEKGKIYLNAQTWSVISGVADQERAQLVMDAVKKHLECKAGPVLVHPAYTRADDTIGYLTRYSPGVRENGGVYTHAATWAVIAAALVDRSEQAYRVFSKINPINRGMNPDEYTSEPYVTAGSIEGPASAYFGRGGWTWYTGSAAWAFRAAFDWILGIRASIDGLIIDPHIPKKWRQYTVTRKFRGATYIVTVRNPKRVASGVAEVHEGDRPFQSYRRLDRGVVIPPLSDCGKHELIVIMGRNHK